MIYMGYDAYIFRMQRWILYIFRIWSLLPTIFRISPVVLNFGKSYHNLDIADY